MAKDIPYFRWFPKDAESDARYAAMSFAELGLYHRCLNHSWMNDGLPEDIGRLARELRASDREVRKLWPAVEQCFVLCQEDNRTRNPRQEKERSHALTKSKKATDAINARYGRDTASGTSVCTDVPPRAYGSGSEEPTIFENTSNPKTSLKRENEDWFASEFWPLWPVKVGKEPAKRACLKIKTEERETVLNGVREQSPRIVSMERPIHPATWINDRRWEDEAPLLRSFQNGSPHKSTFSESVERGMQERMKVGLLPL